MIIPFNTAMIPDIPRYTDSRFSARVGPIHLVESWNSSLDRTEEPDNPAEIFVSLTPLILRRPALSSLFATETSARRWRTKGDKREGANKKLAKLYRIDFKTSREGIISSPSFVMHHRVLFIQSRANASVGSRFSPFLVTHRRLWS